MSISFLQIYHKQTKDWMKSKLSLPKENVVFKKYVEALLNKMRLLTKVQQLGSGLEEP